MGRANSSGTVQQRDVDLTERQSQVLRLITEGKTNAEIGEALGISLDGAKWHVSEILSKLDVSTREEAAEYWRARQGLRSRTLRVLRSFVPGLGWLKVGGAVAAVAAVSAAVVFVVVALRNSGTGDTGPLAAASQAPATATSTPSQLSLRPWAWNGDAIDDWSWVSSFGGTVYVSSGPQSNGSGAVFQRPGKVTALDLATGNERWTFDTPSQPFPVAQWDGQVVFGTASGTVYALEAATGRQLWERPFSGVPFTVASTSSALLVADGVPTAWWGPSGIVDKSRLGGLVEALDPATGQPRWQARVGRASVFIATIGDNFLAVSSSGGAQDEASLFDASGNVKWSKSLTAISSPPVVTGQVVVLAGTSMDELDLAIGTQLWHMPPRNGGTFLGPSIQDGSVVVATDKGDLEVRSLSMGSLSALGRISYPRTALPSLDSDCGFLPLSGSPYVLACGMLMKIDLGPQAVTLSAVLIPQGIVQSATLAFGQIFVATSIGGAAPPTITHFDPAHPKAP